MRVKVVRYNKNIQSIEDLKENLRDLVAESPFGLAELKAAENSHTGNFVFTLHFAGEKVREQEVCILAWVPLERVEDVLNSTLEQIVAENRTARNINIVPTATSQRALAAMIVEREPEAVSAKAEVKGSADPVRPEEQDPKQAAQPDARGERRARSGS
jgi:hypothetical protein